MGARSSKNQQEARPTSQRFNSIQPPTQAKEAPLTPVAIKQSSLPNPTPPRLHHPQPSSEVGPMEKAISHLSLVDNDRGIPVYALSVTDQRVCLFLPSYDKFIEVNRSQLLLNTIKEGEIYHIPAISVDGIRGLYAITDERRKSYIERKTFECATIEAYQQVILPALLLGSRGRDFEQRCAQVEQMGEFVLSAQRGFPKKLKLRTVLGHSFEVNVKKIQRNDEDRRWMVTCHTPTEPMPTEVKKGCLLEIMSGFTPVPRVTDALMQPYLNAHQPNTNWSLLSAIYGESSHRIHPRVTSSTVSIHLAKNAGVRHLNPEQAEAVARYNTPSIPAFAIEAPPGSGKTMTAAAMAVSYKGKGVQLFLSTANVPVLNMALELAKLDYGSLKAIHFISSECEGRMTEENRSPFSVLSLAKASERLRETIERLEEEKARAPNDEERKKAQDEINKVCGPIYDTNYDIYFATIDMILGRLFKQNLGGRHQVDFTKKQLQTNVERVVIDEASQLTEAALNAIIHSFPMAQIVLIGDSKQLVPFKYAEGDVVSELAARSALEVMKDKKNLPVIKLCRVYRASSVAMAHYNHVFYDGKLVSERPEPKENPLLSLGPYAKGSSCLYWQVKGFTQQRGTSKVNSQEINTLQLIVNHLRQSKIDEKDVMIISYYDAQRKAAEDALPKGYEILTVDSAQVIIFLLMGSLR